MPHQTINLLPGNKMHDFWTVLDKVAKEVSEHEQTIFICVDGHQRAHATDGRVRVGARVRD